MQRLSFARVLRAMVLVALVAVSLASATAVPNPSYKPRYYDGSTMIHRELRLRSGAVKTHETPAFGLDAAHDQALAAPEHYNHNGHFQYIVNLKATALTTVRASLEGLLGRALLSYLPHNSYIIMATPAQAKSVASLPGVLWVGFHRPSYRTHATTLSTFTARAAESADHTIAVQLAPELSGVASPVDLAAAHEGVEATVSHLPGVTVLRSEGSRYALVTVPAAHSAAAVTALLSHPLVSWVEERVTFKALNQYSKQVVQHFADSTSTTAFATAGLNGANQIIGVADTGLDMSSCFFFDGSNGTPYGTSAAQASSSHRKVMLYMSAVQNNNAYKTDYISGHGTHVAGSTAGKSLGSLPAYNAAASEAKLVFFDFGDDEGKLFSFADMATDVLKPAFDVGARIHSNSWGSATNGAWTTTDLQTDEFVYSNPTMLVLYAAGNDGGDGYQTVGSPATFKNGIGVGASDNSYIANQDAYGIAYARLTIGATVYSNVFRNPDVGGHLLSSVTAVISYKGTSCTFSGVSGKILVYGLSGSCTVESQLTAALAQSPAAVIIVASKVGYIGLALNPDPTINILVVDASLGAQLNSRDGSSCTIDNTPTSYSADPSNSKESIACFSSRGPTLDHRIQPLVTAPGNKVISAYSNGNDNTNQCDVIPLQGTSMATPTLASTAAIVRQYFTAGFYPTGAAVPANALTPSAALMKAVIVNSAQPLTGEVDQNCDGDLVNTITSLSQDQMRRTQGFGRVQLDKTLFLTSGTRNLYVADESTTALSSGQMSTTCFTLTAGQAAVFTLAWTDPAASASSDVMLVNDLDLRVQYGTTVVLGNQIAATTAGGLTVALPDGANNLEQVTLPSTVSGSVTVSVIGAHVPGAAQKFALVATGGVVFNSAGCATLTCPAGCSSHGTCTNGVCTCTAGFVGADCATAIAATVTVGGAAVSGTVPTGGWVYYSITPTTNSIGLIVTITQSTGNPDWYGVSGSYPYFSQFTDYNFVDTEVKDKDNAHYGDATKFYIDAGNLAVNVPYTFAAYGELDSVFSDAGTSSTYTFTVAAGNRPKGDATAAATNSALIAGVCAAVGLAALF